MFNLLIFHIVTKCTKCTTEYKQYEKSVGWELWNFISKFKITTYLFHLEQGLTASWVGREKTTQFLSGFHKQGFYYDGK